MDECEKMVQEAKLMFVRARSGGRNPRKTP